MAPVNRSDNHPARKRAKTNTSFSPVSKIQKKLKVSRYSSRTRRQNAALYTTTLLEYLAAVSDARATHNKRTRLSPRFIMLTIRNNIELLEMMKDVIISQGSMVLHIDNER